MSITGCRQPTRATSPLRPLRADAQRDYQKLVSAAREAFGEQGAQASLDDIAKRAGVGPGTLYGYFPTRDDPIHAVMREWAAPGRCRQRGRS